MKLCKIAIKKLILIIVLISILITFLATPVSNAALDLEDGEFYYAGSTEGSYKPGGTNIFAWILKALGDIADFILGLLTLAPRMVFVGWTALVEKALTWAVESSAGVSSDGSIVENPTDLTALTDSGNNITVEAIVYNKVAALNADIFDLEMDRTLSPTGHRLVCDKCGIYTDDYGLKRYSAKYVDECCNQSMVETIIAHPDQYKDTLFKQVTIEDVPGFCSCACGGDETCYGCSMYFEQLTVEKPTIILIKENIATWYYIIRMLAMAIMLVVLIAVGIKMALSTIASDKAVYKRMLVDWVVGVIMLFTLHYFMVFVINLNAITVGIIEETAQKVNQASLAQAAEDLNMDLQDELHSKDLEIRVYEEIRTRAYDAKLSNGIIGMVMYMALVFMAVKYTFIYLKRLLTIMVLTLMAPGVGVAYALQKVLTGKSQALKTWMTEYIMNVIIQTIHALIYAIFISQALILSLTNIAGMIVALVFLNYAAKAEETFKKIFKFGGKDSLVGHTDNAMEAMSENINTAKGLVMGAKPAAKILTNTPYAKALKGIGKMAAAGAYMKASKLFNESKAALEAQDDRVYETAYDEALKGVESYSPDMDEEAKKAEAVGLLADMGIINPKYKRNPEKFAEEIDAHKKALDNQEAAAQGRLKAALEAEEKMKQEKEKNASSVSAEMESEVKNELKAAKENEESVSKTSQNFRSLLLPNNGDVAIKHMQKLLDIENNFNVTMPKGAFDFKTHKANITSGAFSEMAFGTATFDPIKMKYVKDNNSAYDKLFSEQLFGFSEKDKKMFKEHVLKPMSQTFIGMGSLFVGMGTIVTEPKLGMGLLASGISQTAQAGKRIRSIKKCENRYSFSRFSPAAVQKIGENGVEQARKERRSVIAQLVKTRRPNFIQNFVNGDIEAATLGLATGLVLSPALTAVHGYRAVRTTFFPKPGKEKKKRSVSEVTNDMQASKGTTKISNTETMGVNNEKRINNSKDSVSVEENIKPARFTRVFSENAHVHALMEYLTETRNSMEEKFTEDSKNLAGEQLKAENISFIDNLDKKEENQGYEYDEKAKVLVRRETVQQTDLKEEFVQATEKEGKPSEKVIDEKLDRIIREVAGRDGKIDISSKGKQEDIISKLMTELVAAKLITKDQTEASIFKRGKEGLVQVIKGKAGKLQEQQAADQAIRDAFSPQEFSKVTSAIDTAMASTGKGNKKRDINEVLAAASGILNPSKDGSQQVSSSDGARSVNVGNAGDLVVSFGGGKLGEKRVEAIQTYIASRQTTPKTATSKKRVVAEFVSSALAEFSSTDDAKKTSTATDTGEDSEAVIRKMRRELYAISNDTTGTAKTITVNGKEFTLEREQAQAANDVVRNLLDMMELNKSSIEIDMKNGTKSFVEKKKKKSTLAIELSQLERQSLYMQNNPGGQYTQSAEQVHKRIKKKTEEIRSVESDMKIAGPVVDIGQVIGTIKKQATDGSKRVPKKNNGDRKAGGK